MSAVCVVLVAAVRASLRAASGTFAHTGSEQKDRARREGGGEENREERTSRTVGTARTRAPER